MSTGSPCSVTMDNVPHSSDLTSLFLMLSLIENASSWSIHVAPVIQPFLRNMHNSLGLVSCMQNSLTVILQFS